MGKIRCPICLGMYVFRNNAGDVCKIHQDWVVTRCSCCNRRVFSNESGICPSCKKHSPQGLIIKPIFRIHK